MEYEFELPDALSIENQEKIDIQIFLNKNKRAMLFLIYTYKNQPLTNRELFLMMDRNASVSKKTVDLIGMRLENKGLVHRVTPEEALDAITSQKNGLFAKIMEKHRTLLKTLKGWAKTNTTRTRYYIITNKGIEWLPFCFEKLNIKYKEKKDETKKHRG